MVEVPITIACGNYDRTRAIRDGRVKVEGCAVTYLPLYPEEIFFRAFRQAEFDILGLRRPVTSVRLPMRCFASSRSRRP